MKTRNLFCILIALTTAGCSGYRVFDEVELPEIKQKPDGSLVVVVEPTFESINKNIIQAKCVLCHSQGGPAEHVHIANYEDLIATAVAPGDPEGSPLYLIVQPDSEPRMPPRTSTVAPLSEQQIAAIKDWITAGALK